MNQALSSADAKLGTPPSAGPSIVAVAGLQPAADMSHDTTVLQGAHADLLAVRAALADARADGLKVISDLHAERDHVTAAALDPRPRSAR